LLYIFCIVIVTNTLIVEGILIRSS